MKKLNIVLLWIRRWFYFIYFNKKTGMSGKQMFEAQVKFTEQIINCAWGDHDWSPEDPVFCLFCGTRKDGQNI